MKQEQEDGPGAEGFLDQPRECSLGELQRPEIVGQMQNPSLEAIRSLWWRAFDRVCDSVALVRVSIHDRILGPESPTAADLIRKAEHERLVRAFPVVNDTIEAIKHYAGQNRERELGSPY
jgi:hypothetical protein